jgi:hypothetical protein
MPDHIISFSVVGKILLFVNPASSPKLEPGTVFGFVAFSLIIFSPKQTIFGLWAFLLSYLASELQKYSHLDWNPGHIFKVLFFLKSLPGFKKKECQILSKSVLELYANIRTYLLTVMVLHV